MGLVLSDIFRAMVVFPHKSGVARNNMVNTFHFRNDFTVSSVQEVSDAIRDLLVRFYGTVGTGASASITIHQRITGNYLRPYLRVYDLGVPDPREPIISDWPTGAANAPSGSGTSVMPEEVAAVISWGSAVIPPKIGKPGLRGRGRTYIGGLVNSCLTVDPTTSLVRIDNNFRHLLATKAHELAAASTGPVHQEKPQLVILSPTYARADPVTRGWVDNAFDTMRRRGGDPSVKTTFTIADGLVHTT